MRLTTTVLVALATLVAGCDLLGIEGASAVAAKREAEGKAIGGACRHAGRALEDCYALNKKADKGAVFAGWREMNDYMRENKIEDVVPQIAAAQAKPAPKAEDDEAEHDSGGGKAGEKGAEKSDKAEKTGARKAKGG